MTDHQFDLLLRDALQTVGDTVVCPEWRRPHRFSRRFERKMERLFEELAERNRSAANPEPAEQIELDKPIKIRFNRRFFVTTFVLLFLATSAMGSNSNKIVHDKFILNDIGRATKITMMPDPDAPTHIEDVYLPTVLPEGYKIAYSSLDIQHLPEVIEIMPQCSHSYSLDYYGREFIRIAQYIKEDLPIGMNTEVGKIVPCQVNGYDALFLDSDEKRVGLHYIWDNGDYIFDVRLWAEENQEEIFQEFVDSLEIVGKYSELSGKGYQPEWVGYSPERESLE